MPWAEPPGDKHIRTSRHPGCGGCGAVIRLSAGHHGASLFLVSVTGCFCKSLLFSSSFKIFYLMVIGPPTSNPPLLSVPSAKSWAAVSLTDIPGAGSPRAWLLLYDICASV